MKMTTLMYHDAIKNGDFAAPGFSSVGSNLYKMDIDAIADTASHGERSEGW